MADARQKLHIFGGLICCRGPRFGKVPENISPPLYNNSLFPSGQLQILKWLRFLTSDYCNLNEGTFHRFSGHVRATEHTQSLWSTRNSKGLRGTFPDQPMGIATHLNKRDSLRGNGRGEW